jgi:hypothetical protein
MKSAFLSGCKKTIVYTTSHIMEQLSNRCEHVEGAGTSTSHKPMSIHVLLQG